MTETSKAASEASEEARKSEIREARDRSVDAVREELRRLVWESGKTQKVLEEENGFARGYLSQVLNGHMSLTARHIFGVLLSLEVPPSSFFSRLFPDDRGHVAIGEIRERMARYDSALRELQEKGLLTLGDPEDGSTAGSGDASAGADDRVEPKDD